MVPWDSVQNSSSCSFRHFRLLILFSGYCKVGAAAGLSCIGQLNLIKWYFVPAPGKKHNFPAWAAHSGYPIPCSCHHLCSSTWGLKFSFQLCKVSTNISVFNQTYLFSWHVILDLLTISFLKRFYLFIFWEKRGREKERERNTSVREIHCLVASRVSSTRDLAHNPGMCPDWELNQRPICS